VGGCTRDGWPAAVLGGGCASDGGGNGAACAADGERDSEENQMKMNGDEKVRVDEDEDCSELFGQTRP
jgi:hypothetical protein